MPSPPPARRVLSNAGNTISGAGTIGNLGLTLFNGGKIIGNGAANELFLILNNGFNSGTLEGTTSQGLLISATQLNQTTSGVVLASGAGARVHLGDITIHQWRYDQDRRLRCSH